MTATAAAVKALETFSSWLWILFWCSLVFFGLLWSYVLYHERHFKKGRRKKNKKKVR